MKFNNREMRGYLTGPEVQDMMYRAGYLAEAIFQALAPRDTGALASSAVVDVEVSSPYQLGGPRWVATLSTTVPYGVPVEFGYQAKVKSRHGRPVAPARALRRTAKAVRL